MSDRPRRRARRTRAGAEDTPTKTRTEEERSDEPLLTDGLPPPTKEALTDESAQTKEGSYGTKEAPDGERQPSKSELEGKTAPSPDFDKEAMAGKLEGTKDAAQAEDSTSEETGPTTDVAPEGEVAADDGDTGGELPSGIVVIPPLQDATGGGGSVDPGSALPEDDAADAQRQPGAEKQPGDGDYDKDPFKPGAEKPAAGVDLQDAAKEALLAEGDKLDAADDPFPEALEDGALAARPALDADHALDSVLAPRPEGDTVAMSQPDLVDGPDDFDAPLEEEPLID